jgi:hypothetical protein
MIKSIITVNAITTRKKWQQMNQLSKKNTGIVRVCCDHKYY